ncbi:MAG TPA: cation diffusion facilitator family transporter [Streptosporangiaceae bacterium]|jgi:cobalt-zinc-cadmium efflux system protein
MGTGHSDAAGGPVTAAARHRGRLAVVLAITAGIAAAEVVGALVSGSLVLLADAAHMATDAAGVGLSLLAVFFAARPATDRRTFGYARAEILAATVNALVLFGLAVFIVTEAVRRLASPPAVESGLMVVFGVVALAGNGVSLMLLRHGQAESLNIRGAFLEVAADTFGAAAVIVAGVVVAITGSALADPVASLAVAVLILPRTWRLLKDAVDVLLEASPRDMDLTEVRAHMVALDGVVGVHDLHAWTITSGLPVLSAHVVVDPAVLVNGRSAMMLDALQACLRGHFDVTHSTFQLEPSSHAGHEPTACLLPGHRRAESPRCIAFQQPTE